MIVLDRGNGYKALYNNTTGAANLASGAQALYANTSGFYNMANGAFALVHNITGNYNVGEGLDALFNNSRGNAGAGDSQCRATKINHCPAGKSDCCVQLTLGKSGRQSRFESKQSK